MISVFCSIWAGISLFIPASVYFRDSGEFILSSFFLDVGHPAGFPLYSQLSNLFSLIPFGPIAWRVNAFSTFIAYINLCLSGVLCFRILNIHLDFRKNVSIILSFVPLFVLINADSYLKQAYTAEVYLLNCLFIQSLIILYSFYLETNNVRFLLLSSFISGIALGNHVSIILFIIPCIVVLITDRKKLAKIIVSMLSLGILGLFIYGYVPIRARSSPPLNTGEAISLGRFLRFSTDTRDLEIRPRSELKGEKSSFIISSLLGLAKNERKIRAETNFLFIPMALLGLIILFRRQRRLGALVFFAMASNLYIFSGWDPDPWSPVLVSGSIGGAVFIATLASRLRRYTYGFDQVLPVIIILLLALPIVLKRNQTVTKLVQLRDFDLPARLAHGIMRDIAQDSILLLQPSWFISKYLRDIEGYRPDLALIYQPEIFFPYYFSRAVLKGNNQNYFDSFSFLTANPGTINKASLSGFLGAIPEEQKVYFEPNPPINGPFRNISVTDSSILPWIQKGTASNQSEGFYLKQIELAGELRTASRNLWKPLKDDTTNFLEVRMNGSADFLQTSERNEEAVKLLETACAPVYKSECSHVTLNNIATYIMSNREYLEAARLYLYLYHNERKKIPEVKHNLKLSLGHLSKSQVTSLLTSLKIPKSILEEL